MLTAFVESQDLSSRFNRQVLRNHLEELDEFENNE